MFAQNRNRCVNASFLSVNYPLTRLIWTKNFKLVCKYDFILSQGQFNGVVGRRRAECLGCLFLYNAYRDRTKCSWKPTPEHMPRVTSMGLDISQNQRECSLNGFLY